ncbi:CatA-like O-acetyltransferase [Aequorivita sp. SDUM287046]|uniref:CatA-like O-acetyltransferase n=1 Tax=Aequorivita aurantiaca TaxID=3053356 RepID=A0ABT8DFR7_9FLAO|nr:CatA-like O-acetyltransferase [Aequorivita aurantiaca]MDN3724202.1 CatA-like O-acetyltransferase [Aequorivita aurantiaca]
MNLIFAKYLIILVLLTNCGKQETVIKNYGFPKSKNRSLNVPLELSQYKTYGILLDRIREVTCNDSIAKIVVKQKNLIRNLYPIEHCEPIKFDPKGKHYVTFNKGKAFLDHFSKEIKTDDLRRILTTDFVYSTSNKSDIPESYLIIIESIHFSAIPWIDFTSISHARSFSHPDSCPKISFGKMTETNGRKSMPISIHGHHALMDGYHVGQFIDQFQKLMSE